MVFQLPVFLKYSQFGVTDEEYSGYKLSTWKWIASNKVAKANAVTKVKI